MNEFDPASIARTLTIFRDQLLAARDRASRDPNSWGGWSVRFNQRLRGLAARNDLLVLPESGEAEQILFEAVEAVRALWEEMNHAVAGKPARVATARIEMERALIRARKVRVTGDDRAQ